MPFKNPDDRRAYMREWKRKNPEKSRAAAGRYRDGHRAEIKKRRDKHRLIEGRLKMIPAEAPEVRAEKARQNALRYKRLHTEEVRVAQRRYYEANKDTISARKKQWYLQNKERLLAKAEAYREQKRKYTL